MKPNVIGLVIGEEVMLLDCYNATVATVGGDGYRELTLYEYSDDELKLCRYSKSEDSDEICEAFLAPKKALDECMALAEKYRLAEWSEMKDLISLDGALKVIRLRLDDGSYIRVSSEEMPESGENVFGEMESLLLKYLDHSKKL